jgi:hypothetical protein
MRFRKSLLVGLCAASLGGVMAPMTANAAVEVYLNTAPPPLRVEAVPARAMATSGSGVLGRQGPQPLLASRPLGTRAPRLHLRGTAVGRARQPLVSRARPLGKGRRRPRRHPQLGRPRAVQSAQGVVADNEGARAARVTKGSAEDRRALSLWVAGAYDPEGTASGHNSAKATSIIPSQRVAQKRPISAPVQPKR